VSIISTIIKRFKAPALPFPTRGYDPDYFNQLLSILRIYFNQLDNLLNQIVATTANPIPVSIGGTNVDAFGRLRTSSPLTLFDSSHRFSDNNLWVNDTSAAGTFTVAFNAAQGLVDLTIDTASGSKIIRETTKVFSYQPGKSLLVMSTFVMAQTKTNLRQRVGYFGASNGLYLEQNGSSVYFVERSFVTGVTTDTLVAQANWNQDPLNGTGPSGITLDLSKAQILYIDIEWLGLGTCRLGFIIDGVFVPAHNFNHANLITTTYITTASLPLRYEIENVAGTSSSSTMKQVCSTVISEGGYELRGLQQAIGTDILTPRTLTTAGTLYPVISIRLKSTRLDGIVILTALSIMGITNNANYQWRVVASGTTTGGTWVSAGTSSAVDYNITGTAIAGGRILASGYFQGSNQGSSTIDILKEALFSFQLERNPFTATPYELSLICTAAANGDQVHASMDWEEISR
jgi:hypothetical protein